LCGGFDRFKDQKARRRRKKKKKMMICVGLSMNLIESYGPESQENDDDLLFVCDAFHSAMVKTCTKSMR